MNKDKTIWLLSFMLAFLISCLPHDIYQVGIAIVSIMLFKQIAVIFNNRFVRVAVYCIGGIAFAQLAVILRHGFLVEGFYQTLHQKSTAIIVGDLVYGIRHVWINFFTSLSGLYNGILRDNYSALEGLNYRLTVIGWMVVMTLGSVVVSERKSFRNRKMANVGPE